VAPFAIAPVQKAHYVVLELALPGQDVIAAGVLLLDPSRDKIYLKMRTDWGIVADAEGAEVLEHLASQLESDGRELGGEGLLRRLEDALSNTLRISERKTVTVGDFDRALQRLYQRYVEKILLPSASVRPFQTHLPLYSLRAAAGRFSGDMEVEAEGWVPVPPELRLSKDMFVAQVTGRSMEPMIPDGSLCVFRHTVVGSRQGKLLLIQHRGVSESGGEFTVKRYTSLKTPSAEGWRHSRIRLEPLNPEYEAWDLDPSDIEEGPYRVIGEFVRVLPFEEL